MVFAHNYYTPLKNGHATVEMMLDELQSHGHWVFINRTQPRTTISRRTSGLWSLPRPVHVTVPSEASWTSNQLIKH